MNTWLRLLLMFVTCGGLFAGTWYFCARERPQAAAVPPQQKTTEGLLVGVWKSTRENRNPDLRETLEFARDGKAVLHIEDLKEGHTLSIPGASQLKGKTLQVDYLETPNNEFGTWSATIDSVDETTLVLILSSGKHQRAVLQRVK